MNEDKEIFSLKIKQEALKLGFTVCGICKAEEFFPENNLLTEWLKNGYNGNMKYLENNFDKRLNPSLLSENAKSIIVAGLNYFTNKTQPENTPKISKYAYGNDYHEVIKAKLLMLCEIIKADFPESINKVCVDTIPILEKAAAQRAGIGWIGKHSCVINKDNGSFFFLGEIITSLELQFDSQTKNLCGSCSKCIDCCPTGAIVAPYKLDARKCISYQTIENKGDIPDELIEKFNGWAFGCDICQDVCPWNKKATEKNVIDFEIKPEIANYTTEQWQNLKEDDFKRVFKNSAVSRIKYSQWMRNIRNQ